ncbi:L,D-transpeptidase [Xanthomarina sp.]|uniref:L,D-transpeptidase n=1 Tax=Xanthomarina sp. TaxID=1931211 RepID=UPI002CC61267|nr:L,D-transpeptidase [Xanthomarina sp.]HLV39510.1 L,D-transpeptidase [Xanthomarina sp.]
MKNILFFVLPFLVVSCINSNKVNSKESNPNEKKEFPIATIEQDEKTLPIEIVINKNVPIHSYFKWMDSIVAAHNQTYKYPIDEYIIVHHNNWILDTLAHTDYYYLMDKGIFNEDSKSLIALQKDQILFIPDSIQTQKLKTQLSNTYLDLNIPEFRLRIIQEGKEIYKFPVRVGKNNKRYLAMAKREVDMRTMPGIGEIIRVNKNPIFMNPVNNHKYKKTYRDDGILTALPAIPWIEPAINGRSIGQLIHPTTNKATLEKASSNGCIGLRESDAWIVYYYAPLGTKVVFRYDLQGKNDKGEAVQFKNIYPGFENIKIIEESRDTVLKPIDATSIHICDVIEIN